MLEAEDTTTCVLQSSKVWLFLYFLVGILLELELMHNFSFFKNYLSFCRGPNTCTLIEHPEMLSKQVFVYMEQLQTL